ncbi:MAG: SET domain-containing protein-lysine N-methyltransferase [Verrucomicrobia bacterium]|nr:SET domain-containing protein-lysine N-methyltransferase [Verrucomicrobiota bacterium]
MKFDLTHQIIDEEIRAIIAKEVRRQKAEVTRATQKQLKRLASINEAVRAYGLPKYLVKKKLPGDLGHGIFLRPDAEPIPKGELIAIYSGEVSFVPKNMEADSLYAFEPLSDIRLNREQQKRFDPKRTYHPRRLYSVHVDAVKKGNFSRFVNHSNEPNLVAEFLSIPPNRYGVAPSPLEVVYTAQKRILPGEQLLVCYDGDSHSYWGALDIEPVPINPKTFRLDGSLRILN